MKYSLILFDFDDTLIDFQSGQREAYYAAMAAFEISTNDEHLRIFRALNRHYWQQLELQLVTMAEVLVCRFRDLLGIMRSNVDPAALNSAFVENLASQAQCFPGADEICAELSTKTKLAIVTNGATRVQAQRLRSCGLEAYFSEMVTSEEVGFAKPHQRIFEEALKRTKTSVSEKILMVGDSIDADVKGAKAMGFDSCLISQNGKIPVKGEILPDYCLSNLADLRGVCY